MLESAKETIVIKGLERISSKAFEEMVQAASSHADHLILETYGQHNVGGRIRKKDGHIIIQVKGPSGQRLGCM
ncbi:MAG: hypothetical protein ACUVQ2_01665, partial [Dissulfurimicrobium sp.]|uniref:hypothetical protein n=1 Tax=Dissulfurimicrobium sp. TaxID=2022436 RepID=UPI004049985A